MTKTMAASEILALWSADSPSQVVADVLTEAKDTDYWWYDGLKAALASDPASIPPVHVAPASVIARDYDDATTLAGILALARDGDPLMLGNGHHRVKLMVAAGWTEIPITSHRSQSER